MRVGISQKLLIGALLVTICLVSADDDDNHGSSSIEKHSDEHHSHGKCKPSTGAKANCKLDLTFAIDMSWAMKTRKNVLKLANFTLDKVIDKYAIDHDYSRIAIQTLGTWTFSQSPYFEKYQRACEFISTAAETVQFFGNGFYPLSKVFSSYLASNFFPSPKKRVLVILTAVNDPFNINAAIPLSKLVRKNTKVIVVGINQHNKKYLKNVADEVIYVDLNSYSESISDFILSNTCGRIESNTTVAPSTTTTKITTTTASPVTNTPQVQTTTQNPITTTALPQTHEPSTEQPEAPTTAVTSEPEVPTTVEPEIPSTVEPNEPSTQQPIEPSTAGPIEPSTPQHETSTTAEPIQPSSVEPESPTTATTNEPEVPTTAAPIQPSTEQPEVLTTTAEPELPSTTHEPNPPSTVQPEEPSTSQPQTPTTAEPIQTSSVEPESPTTEASNVPSTNEPEVPTTATPFEPSTEQPEVHTTTAEPENPSTQQPFEPSTESPIEPSTLQPNQPSTVQPGPTTESPVEPSTDEPVEPTTQQPDEVSTAEPVEPSTADTNGPIAPTNEPLTEQPEASTTVKPEILSTEQPIKPSSPEAPTTTESIEPSTNAPNEPSTGHPEASSTIEAVQPSTENSVTDATNEPSTNFPHEPSTADPLNPSTEKPNESSTAQPEVPSTMEAGDLPTENPIQPSTAQPLDPSTEGSNEPSTNEPEAPTTSQSNQPITQKTNAPSTDSPIEASTEAPVDSTTNQPEVTTTTASNQPSTSVNPSELPTEKPATNEPTNPSTFNPNEPSTNEPAQSSSSAQPEVPSSAEPSLSSSILPIKPTTAQSEDPATVQPSSDPSTTKLPEAESTPIIVTLTPSLPEATTTENPLSDALGSSCSTNVTGAWLDIVFAIDTSASLTPTQLNQFGGLVAGLFRRFTISQTEERSTRVAIVTYGGSEAIVQYDLENIQDWSYLYSALTTVGKFRQNDKTSDISKGLSAAFDLLEKQKSHRIPAIILVGASSNIASIPAAEPLSKSIIGNGTKIVTINFAINHDATDAPLSNLASPNYGFVSNDPNLYSKLTLAFSKINCVCPSLTYQFEINGTTFGDCVQGFNGQTPPDIAQLMCEMSNGILVSVTSQEKLDFIRTKVVKNVFGANPEFTIGLHRITEKSNEWFWFGYSNSAYPLGDFKKWEDGKTPSDSAACGYATRESSDNSLAFAAGGCDYEDARPYLCQTKACDSNHMCDLQSGFKAANAHTKLQTEMMQRMYRVNNNNKRVY